jgi:ABC-type sugar transport system ATPase subunit
MGADPTVVVELEDVHKVYGERGGTPALAGVSLTIAQGAFVSLVGPSGSGKTTLLNVIASLDMPTGATRAHQGTRPPGR